MQTTDSDNLFRSDAELAKQQGRQAKLLRTKTLGDPINLTSKPLGVLIRGSEAWAAESGFILRRFNLDTGKSSVIYKGHTAPVTCLAFYDLPSSSNAPIRRFLLSGSWDKSIKVWDRDTGICLSTTTIHTDFLKCLLPISNLPTPLLLSGSSDKSIQILSLESLASSPSSPLKPVRSIKAHTRPIKKLVLAPQQQPDTVVVYSADSLGKVLSWDITSDREGKVSIKENKPLAAHETSVTDLWVGDDGAWTASMDTFIHYHPLPPLPSNPRIAFPHPANLHPAPAPHAILPLPHLTPPLLLTGSADEQIRVWDLSQGEAVGQARLVREIEGHCAEVTGLQRWLRDGPGGKREEWVVSWGLDGTVRRWKLADMLVPSGPPEIKEEEPRPGGMTEEEERELAELMDDDE